MAYNRLPNSLAELSRYAVGIGSPARRGKQLQLLSLASDLKKENITVTFQDPYCPTK
jgi:hypothetical protein